MRFKIVRARYHNGTYVTRLIAASALAENEDPDFFEHASEVAEIRVIGEVEVTGDDHWLGDSYLED